VRSRLAGTLRLIVRVPALIALTVFVCGTIVVGAVAAGTGRGGWRGPRTARWRTAWFQRWARGVLRVVGVRVELRGQPPHAASMLVSNHLSYLDVALLAAHLHCVFVAKAEVDGWPVVGAMCRLADTVFVERENKRDLPRVIGAVERILGQGRRVVVFPEGTSTKGDGLLPFRPSLLAPAAVAGIPVSYAALSYRTPQGCPPAHLAVCWWGGMPFTGHLIGMLRLPAILARLDFGEEPIVDHDRKELARRLQRAIESRFEPVV